MKISLALLITSLLSIGIAHAAEARKFSGGLAESMAGKRILLVSAHPDDEGLFAPLIAEVCRFNLDSASWTCPRVRLGGWLARREEAAG